MFPVEQHSVNSPETLHKTRKLISGKSTVKMKGGEVLGTSSLCKKFHQLELLIVLKGGQLTDNKCHHTAQPWIYFGALRQKNYTRWFKYDRDYLYVNKSQFVPVIFEPACSLQRHLLAFYKPEKRNIKTGRIYSNDYAVPSNIWMSN
jgi:hypothetical protein